MTQAEFKPNDVPPMPQVVSRIIQIDESNINVSSDQLQSLIAVDPGLTSKILKIANSAFYARSSKVSNLSQAVTWLGFKTIKSLTLLISTKDMFPSRKRYASVQKQLWMRSVLSALIAKVLADRAGQRNIQEEAFMAALLKNIGQLILHARNPEAYEAIYDETAFGTDLEKLAEREQAVFGITSAEVSTLTMETWNFPDEFIKVAKCRTHEVETLAAEAGAIGLIANLAEVIVWLKNLVEQVTLDDEARKRLEEVFAVFGKELNLSAGVREYIASDLEASIRDDSFYTFCMELFSS